MKYKVCNLERDMKLGNKLIKRGESVSVSQQDYQLLAQVYGVAVKGEKEYAVRTTVPVTIETATLEPVPNVPAKKRKNRKK